MEYYRVLLVDDEEEVRAAIARKLDWPSLGFEVVGEASHGEEALEMAKTLQPDVIMTDIKMPFMDGLTLCRRAKALLPGVKLAIFSGFDEFEYAKEAIKLEVQEYILKPIDAEELADVFRRIRKSLDEEIARSTDIERLRQHYEESLPLIRHQILTDLLEGRVEGDIQWRLEEYGIDLAAGQYAVAVLHAEPDASGQGVGEGLLAYSLESLVESVIGPELPYRFLRFYDSIVLLFLLPEGVAARRVAGLLSGLSPIAKKRLGARLSIGLGGFYPTLEEIELSHAEAKEALAHQPLWESGQCIYIGDVRPGALVVPIDSTLIDDIVRQIKVGGREELEAAVMALGAWLRRAPASRQQYQAMMLGISSELFRLIKAYGLESDEAPLTGELLEKSSAGFYSLDELCAWLRVFSENLRLALRQERKASTSALVETAKGYLADHYADSALVETAKGYLADHYADSALVETAKGYLADHYADSDLSADTLCGVLNLSPAYFSTIFKKETGDTFVGYLTRLRMEKALELLHNSDDKTYMIAEKVGYADPNYFSYVFKKQYGLSPSKYRTDRITAHEGAPPPA